MNLFKLLKVIFSLLLLVVQLVFGQEQDACPTNDTGTINAVLVTGSNGFVASWIVKELLERDYTVHACVRDVTNPQKVSHLKALDPTGTRLKLFSTGDLGKEDVSVWEAPLQNCQAVIHVSMAMDWQDGLNGMYHGTVEGTRQLLQAIEQYTPTTIQSFLLTSSTAAVATQEHGIMTDESHWRTAQEDLRIGSYYSATKIAQEQLVTQWAQERKNMQFVSICPTRIIGPPISTSLSIEGWLNQLQDWLRYPPSAENDTMELVHVQDVARFHIAALEHSEAHGRYLCVDESWHWNTFLEVLKELHPSMRSFELYEGENPMPTKQYCAERRNSLPVAFRPMMQILQECVEYLRERGELGDLPIV